MAKMGGGSGLKKIPLTQIVENGNVRFDYHEIAELAASIKLIGQLEPVLVKPLEPDENGERFELISGHRRFKAIKKLHDAGESFTDIQAIAVQGDKLTIQLVENLQRSDLTAPEKENGIYQMCANGLSQTEVAAKLSKPDTAYVSRHISAYKVRKAALAGCEKSYRNDINNLATATLNEIQAAAEADYPALVFEIIQNGGTLEAARRIMENYRASKGKPANPRREKKEQSSGLSDPLELHPSPVTDPIIEELSEKGIEAGGDICHEPDESIEPRIPEKNHREQNDEAKKSGYSGYAWSDDYVPPKHKQVDFNAVCLIINRYAEEEGEKAEKEERLDKAHYHREAAFEIIAQLHKELL